MTKNAVYTVKSNLFIADNVLKMRLEGPTGSLVAPGQFVNVRLDDYYLRRPLSVCDWDATGMDLIYKILGRGTATMAQYAAGTQLDLLTGLGNGFSPAAAGDKPAVLVGGGVGVPPLYGLARAMVAAGQAPPAVVLGFASAGDVFYTGEFEALGCAVRLATEDGSRGEKGFVTRLLSGMDYAYYFACGPQAMLAAVWETGRQKRAQGQLSFEERMGCGFGACMGCSCETLVGPRRVCVDGPVFPSGEVSFHG